MQGATACVRQRVRPASVRRRRARFMTRENERAFEQQPCLSLTEALGSWGRVLKKTFLFGVFIYSSYNWVLYCRHAFLTKKSKVTKKHVWKYLIADKIEFNMKSIETKANFKKLIKEHSATNHEPMHLTITSKYTKQVLWEMQRGSDKSTITGRHFDTLWDSGKPSRRKP